MLTLRDDQQEVLQAARRELTTHQSILVRAATGWGKTVFASSMALGASQRQRRVIFGVHRRELARQTAKTFDQFGIRYGFIAANMRPDPLALVQIASAETLVKRPHLIRGALMVPDEAHLWSSKGRALILSTARENGMKTVGLTATPERLDGRPMADNFDVMVHAPDEAWLIENGHLSEYRAYAPSSMDMTGIRKSGDEWASGDLDGKFNKPAIVGKLVESYLKFARGKRMIGFAFSRKHGNALVEDFRANGVGAVYIDGETPQDERVRRIEMFADGRAFVLINVQLCIEGFDLSAQVGRDVPVEAVGLYNPTRSRARAMQMMGRALRKKPYPAIILDHANIIATHGLPDDPWEYSLDGKGKRPGAAAGEPTIPTRNCASCFATFRPHLSKCPYCETIVVTEGRKVAEVDGELAEIDLEAARARKRKDVNAARSLPDLAMVAAVNGYKAGWIIQKMRARGDKEPTFRDADGAIATARLTLRREWSTADRQALSDMWWNDVPVSDISRRLTRTEDAITAEAKRLKLPGRKRA